jgi:glycosyltransferase involved in cell wall biosynthesis
MRDTPRPLVTIGIAAFNAQDTLQAAVESAYAQTWQPIEVVVVDDCSTDETPALLERLQREHPGLRVLRLSRNGGVAVVRNRIVAEARGEFLAFFDDDDRSDPERVERQVERVVDYERQFAHGAPVISHTARRVVYPDGHVRIEPTKGERDGHPAPSGVAVAAKVLLGKPLIDGSGACPTCSQVARVSTYRALGGFDESLRRGEDTDLVIRLALAGGHFVGISSPLVTQVMTRTSEKSIADEHRSFVRIMEKHRDFIAANGNYEFCCRWIQVKYAWLARQWRLCLPQMLGLMLRHPLLTAQRIREALPNTALNRAFSRFHDTALERS